MFIHLRKLTVEERIVKRKAKTERYKILTKYNPGCLLSKNHQREAFESFIENQPMVE